MKVSYEKLNGFVVGLFFNGRHLEEPVYLNLDVDESQELAKKLNCELQDIEKIVSDTLSSSLVWDTNNPYSWHLNQFSSWKARGDGSPPPFVALLLGLSMAAERMRQDRSYSANNYYERLFEFLKESRPDRQLKLKHSAKSTVVFWKALNSWLIKNDYMLGIPTANQVNSWKYVSYAISQSLVRESEKSKLRKMLMDLGISTHENLSIPDITQYIHQWMSTGDPTSWLRKLWSKTDLRERVATAALHELSKLGSVDSIKNSIMSKQRFLSWVLVKKTFPRKSVNLYMTADEQFQGQCSIENDSVDLFTTKINEQLYMVELTGTNLSFLRASSSLKLDGLLTLPISLKIEKLGAILEHKPKPIITLSLSEAGTYFKEVSRASLFTEHVIICHIEWQSQVMNFLSKNVRNGFRVLSRQDGVEIPENWVVIIDVYIFQNITSNVPDNLQCLVPLSLGNSIQLEGGVKLQHNVWHAEAPPAVLALSQDGLLGVELRSFQFDSETRVITSNCEDPKNINFLQSTIVTNDTANDFILVSKKGNKVLSEKNISLRTANTPRNATNLEEMILSYPLVNEKTFWSSYGKSLSEIKPTETYLRGLSVQNTGVSELEEFSYDFREKLSVVDEPDYEEQSYNLQAITGFAESCILRGYHIWTCPPALTQEDFDRVVRPMTCKDCGSMVLSRKPDIYSRKKRIESNLKINHKFIESRNAPQRFESRADGNLIYDAICYLRYGTWRTLQTICASYISEPWQCYEYARNLCDLGLIDVTFDSSGSKIQRWSVSPPCLVITKNDFAFLSGFRCSDLIEELKVLLNDWDFVRIEQELAPDVIGWNLKACNIEEIRKLLDTIVSRTGERIRLITSCEENITNYLPTLDYQLQASPTISVANDASIEKYEVRANRWRSAEFRGQGAYRSSFNGRTYFYKDKSNICRAMSFELVKLKAALDEGIKMLSYNKDTRKITGLVGCPPPILYRRALIACSGHLPIKQGPKLIYKDIPIHIASNIFTKIYG